MKYEVGLWCGAGYQLSMFEVEADYPEQALERAVVQIENEGKTGLFFDDCDDVEQMEEEGLVLYVDATLEGAKNPHYVDAQNLRIMEVEGESK